MGLRASALELINGSRFRWAHLQLEQMFKLINDKDIVSRLGELPQDLNDSYSEIYKNNTEKLGNVHKSTVERAFKWMICSSLRLPKKFLLEVVRISETGNTDDEIKEKALLQLCQHLLVVEGSRDWFAYWRFPHTSVGEWLETQWSLTDAHSFVAKVCLSKLLKTYDELDPATFRHSGHLQPDELRFLQYARDYWHIHIQALENEAFESLDTEMTGLLKKILGQPDEE